MKVALAIIWNDKNQILITQRPLHVPQGGYWEFPGGKVEAFEEGSKALVREIWEELGLVVLEKDCQYFTEITHHYSDYSVNLLVYQLRNFSGEAHCKEKQLNLHWASLEELKTLSFPAANRVIIEQIGWGFKSLLDYFC